MLHWLLKVLVWVVYLGIDIILMQLKDMIGSLHKFFYFHVILFVHFLRFLLYYVDYRSKLSFIQWLRLTNDPFEHIRVTTLLLPVWNYFSLNLVRSSFIIFYKLSQTCSLMCYYKSLNNRRRTFHYHFYGSLNIN
jgi:hypothetical protein